MSDITLDEFRNEALSFLDANAEKKPPAEDFAWGKGTDEVAIFEEVERDEEAALIEKAKEWRAKRYDAGFGWIGGPEEFGGRNLPSAYERVYASAENQYLTPNTSFFGIGLGMVAPTIRDHARPEVAAKYLGPLFRGDMIACQLFSEPGAGSDLASLQSKAEKDGDEWVITGQKVWTSGAHYSDIGEIICRTDPDLPKHRGLTGFIVDMHAPGVEVRPLRQMTGGAAFNEVFFDEVRVPDDHLLGDVNQGWTVALTTLMNERASIGAGGSGSGMGLANITRLAQMLEHFDQIDDVVRRDELMALYIDFQVAKYTNQRAMDKIKAGGLPGPEMSIAKLALTDNLRSTGAFVAKVLGPRMTADTGQWGTFAWGKFVSGIPGMAIAGGTDEVLRNIIGERVLGLPKEPGIDTTSPFKELKVGTQSD